MKKIIMCAISILSMASVLRATSDVTINNAPNNAGLYDTGTNALAVGSIVRYGIVTNISALNAILAGGVLDTELASLNALFIPLFTTTVGTGTGNAGTLNITTNVNVSGFSGFTNMIMAYNVTSLANIDSATQVGLFAEIGSSPLVPNDLFAGGFSPNSRPTLSGNALYGSIIGQITGTEGFLLGAVIPEPGTVAALVAGLIALPFVRRMRKNS